MFKRWLYHAVFASCVATFFWCAKEQNYVGVLYGMLAVMMSLKYFEKKNER